MLYLIGNNLLANGSIKKDAPICFRKGIKVNLKPICTRWTYIRRNNTVKVCCDLDTDIESTIKQKEFCISCIYKNGKCLRYNVKIICKNCEHYNKCLDFRLFVFDRTPK
jgi:hypothetical protein